MDFISHLYNGGNLWISSIIWGIIVAVCPCTMAANITAITAMSRDKREKRDVFARGIAYAFGRAAAYIALGILLVTFAQGLRIGESFQHLFGLFLGPILVLIGILMLDIIHIHGLADKCMVVFNRMVKQFGFWKSFLLGIMLAFAFCPYSATIYFGVVIPSSLSADTSYRSSSPSERRYQSCHWLGSSPSAWKPPKRNWISSNNMSYGSDVF